MTDAIFAPTRHPEEGPDGGPDPGHPCLGGVPGHVQRALLHHQEHHEELLQLTRHTERGVNCFIYFIYGNEFVCPCE